MQFHFPEQTGFYRGKVRDVYYIQNRWVIMIASDRISAFDVILPELIPFKGQVLNQIAAFMLDACKDICTNWLLCTPGPNASIGYKCEPFKIEVVVRGNLTGHAWRTYAEGARSLCGAILPAGLTNYDFLPNPIITPSTKADAGHDEDISPEEIIHQRLCTAEEWKKISEYALELFERGKNIAHKQGLILADTKYEFGKLDGEICLMDEIHTPDSSRYFYLEGFEDKRRTDQPPQQLSKEFVREWLMENNFMGRKGDVIPEMSTAWIAEISKRYISLYETLTGSSFIREVISDNALQSKLSDAISTLIQPSR